MKQEFGKTSKGDQTSLFIMKNRQGMEISVTDYGATLVGVKVPDKNGDLRDVVLGYDDVTGYEEGNVFLGAVVGRSANRIGGAKFTINGKTYKLTKNDNQNNLHSGNDYYFKRIWNVKEEDESHIVLSLFSPDGDQGYPGNADITVTYTLTDENEIKIHYNATADADTIFNLMNHSYFNLNGNDSGDILAQKVWIDADAFTPADEYSIPTGEIAPVDNTPMDFRTPKALGRDIEEEYEPLKQGMGYDHNWVLNGKGYRKVAGFIAEESGITMDVYTDLPGMHLYTANFIEKENGKCGAEYRKRHAVCFETQYFPDAVNKEQFESPVVKAGEMYDSTTTYKFGN